MTFFGSDLERLADRCEAGAAQLRYEAEHAAEVLAERGYPDADADEWAARKASAAAAADEYATGLLNEAADGGPVEETRFREAEKVAAASELGGILIDGRRAAEAPLNTPSAFNDAERQRVTREFWERETAAIEGSGQFEHVAETIDGVRQVPFWQLRADTAADEAAVKSVDSDDDADGM